MLDKIKGLSYRSFLKYHTKWTHKLKNLRVKIISLVLKLLSLYLFDL